MARRVGAKRESSRSTAGGVLRSDDTAVRGAHPVLAGRRATASAASTWQSASSLLRRTSSLQTERRRFEVGRLTAVSGPNQNATYTLDGAGNRVAATVNGSPTTFDLDPRGLPTVLMEGGRKYLPGMPEAGYDEGGTWWNALTSQQGSVHQFVSQAGAGSDIYRYDAYGSARPGSATPPRFGYAGEWRDASDLYNLRARAYDPSLGRLRLAGLLRRPRRRTADRQPLRLRPGEPIALYRPLGPPRGRRGAQPGTGGQHARPVHPRAR